MSFKITVDQWEIEVLHHAFTDRNGGGLLGGAEVVVPSEKGPRKVKFAGCWDYAEAAGDKAANVDEILYVDDVFVQKDVAHLSYANFAVFVGDAFSLVCDEDGGPDLESIAYEIHKATKIHKVAKVAHEYDWRYDYVLPNDSQKVLRCHARNEHGTICSVLVRHTGTPHLFCLRQPHDGFCSDECFNTLEIDRFRVGLILQERGRRAGGGQ